MIVRHFLHWIRTASPDARADATGALARAYLYSDLSPDDRLAAEGAMIMQLDDPDLAVRRSLAEALGASPEAPRAVILALGDDLPEIAAIVLERSPLFTELELVDLVGSGELLVQVAVARRANLQRSVCAAIAEVGAAEACIALIENEEADILPFSVARMLERHGELGAIRTGLLGRKNLPAVSRQALVAKLSEILAGFVSERDWLEPQRAECAIREACEKATVAVAADSASAELKPLVQQLSESGRLTPGLMLRALLCGNVEFFEQALIQLSGLPPARVAALVHDRHGTGLRALCSRAGLPASIYPAFRAALGAMHEVGFLAETSGRARLKRRMVERVLTLCEGSSSDDVMPLLALLRRFATEAARDEARLLCHELVAA